MNRRPDPQVLRAFLLCPNLELGEWLSSLAPGAWAVAGTGNPRPAAVTPDLCLVSNVNLSDSKGFTQKAELAIRPGFAAVPAAVCPCLVARATSDQRIPQRGIRFCN